MITASLVKELREKTGAGMMDCKKVLTETDGDLEKAAELLRERGIAKAAKKSGRVAAEGMVEAYVSEDGKVGVIVEVNAETDFVSKNEEFRAFVSDVAEIVAKQNPANVEALQEVKYKDSEKLPVPKDELKKARAMPKGTDDEKAERTAKIREIRKTINEINDINEEIEIASFVNFELERFSTDFGSKQLELVKLIVDAGENFFYNVYDEAVKLAYALPKSGNKEEKLWRRQEIRNAKALRRSARLAKRYYTDGAVSFDRQVIDDAYDMPDDTREQQKIRRKAMKKANKEMNRYTKVATPYLSALRTVRLAEGYSNIDMILEDYEDVRDTLLSERESAEAEARQLAEQRKLDAERKKQQRKLKNKK